MKSERITCGAICTVVYISVFAQRGISVQATLTAVLLILLFCIAGCDIRKRVIPPALLWCCAVIHAAQNVVAAISAGSGFFAVAFSRRLFESFCGAMLTATLMICAVFGSELVLKRKLLGGGDLRLLILLGACAGAETSLTMLWLVCVFGLIQAGAALAINRKNGAFALAPSIFLAAWSAALLL